MAWSQQKYPRPLSKRLQHIFDLLRPGWPVWDFGCDHGHLGEAAWRSGNFGPVHLIDVSPEIINRTRLRLENRFGNLTGLNFYTLDAAKQNLKPFGNIVLAGLGGQTVNGIIANQCPHPTTGTRLILAPHRNADEVRAFCAGQGWRLVTDYLINERRRWYELIVCEIEGETIDRFGNHYPQSVPLETQQYWQQRLDHYHRQIKSDPKAASIIGELEKVTLRHLQIIASRSEHAKN